MVQLDIPMPKTCYECPCHDGENNSCQVTGKYYYDEILRSCPLIDAAPTADVVEVVRCRNCIHGIPTRIDTVTKEVSDERYCLRHHMCHFGDYYCADGE